MIAVDANVLLEIIESRNRKTAVRNAIAAYGNQDESLGISTLSVSHLFYLAEAHKIPLKRVEQVIAPYLIYDVVAADVEWALGRYVDKDFEDALQIAAALREKCTTFITLDTLLAKKYNTYLTIELI